MGVERKRSNWQTVGGRTFQKSRSVRSSYFGWQTRDIGRGLEEELELFFIANYDRG